MILSKEDCLKNILSSVEQKIPSSFIRKGDGENIVLGFRTIGNIPFLKYRKKLIHFNIKVWDFSFQKFIKKELLTACCSATILGISPAENRHGFWALEDEILSHFSMNDQVFGDVNFHMEFIKIPEIIKLMNPISEAIISNRKIGIIGHFKVEDLLKKYNSRVLTRIEIPRRRARFQRMTREKYDIVLTEIRNLNSQIDIWLVAAGIYAKPFCEHIRKNGGIGIDIGSSLDTWVDEYHSRGHLRKLLKRYDEN